MFHPYYVHVRREPWSRVLYSLYDTARVFIADEHLGKLLTTPSRLLKLILPLDTADHNSDRKDIEPLVLLVHPQQPLSYLERLIQSEIPSIKNDRGEDKIPYVQFRAQNFNEDAIKPRAKHEKKDVTEEDMHEDAAEGGHGDSALKPASSHEANAPSPDDESPPSRPFVRWSPSTDVGDFIRDAARGAEFAVQVEGSTEPIIVGVPSFNDRTHFLRQRLRKTSKKIADLAKIKRECDLLAHRGAQRVAVGGAGLLVGYWYIVYRLTFETDLGWDTMEPVTVCTPFASLYLSPDQSFLFHLKKIAREKESYGLQRASYSLKAKLRFSISWAFPPSYVVTYGFCTTTEKSLTGRRSISPFHADKLHCTLRMASIPCHGTCSSKKRTATERR